MTLEEIGVLVAVITLAGSVVGALIKAYLWYREKRSDSNLIHNFEEKGFEWLFERNLTYVDLLKRLIAIDVASIPHLDYDDPAEGTANQWAPVFEHSKESWRLIIYNDTLIAAYWQAVSLKPAALQRLKRGTLKDSRIFDKDIRKLDEPGDHSIYLIYIGRHPDFDKDFGSTLFKKLMQSIADFSARLDEQGITVREVFANGQTEIGIALCRAMNMTKVGEIAQGGPLYHSSYSALNWKYLQKFKN